MSGKIRQIDETKSLVARGLWTLAHTHYKKARDAESALADLLGYEEVYCDCLSDAIYDENGDFDKAMKKEGFVVAVNPSVEK